MSCEVNTNLKESLVDIHYQTLIDNGLTSEQALKEINKMFEDLCE